MSEPERGTIYLLCIDPPVRHARHYLGWTSRAAVVRLEEHVSGRGSPLVHAARRGSAVDLVRTWPDATRTQERALKDRKNARFLCPRCKPAANAEAKDRMRRIRANRKRRAAGLESWSQGVRSKA